MLRQLPGIRITRTRPQPSALPRMDVACFVGFAAKGPLHLPVLIENMVDYGRVFGGEVVLARADDAPQRAYLMASIRTFFANGGQRCYVIRVADARQAITQQNVFPLAGVVRAIPGTTRFDFRQAYARGTSPGSWSDGLGIRTTGQRTFIDTADINLSDNTLATAPGETLHRGDTLKLTYSDVQYFLVVDTVRPADNGITVTWQSASILKMQLPDSDNTSRLALLRWETAPDVETNASVVAHEVLDTSAGILRITINRPPRIPPAETFFWATFRNRLLLQAHDIGVNPDDDSQVIITGSALVWLEGNPAPDASVPTVEKLTFGIQAGETAASSGLLGFAPTHPRYWGAIPDDQQRYISEPDAFATQMKSVGFPLAGMLTTIPYMSPDVLETIAQDVIRIPRVCIPLGMTPLPIASPPPMPPNGTPLERDGLSNFRAAIFLDEDMVGNTMTTLKNHADNVRYRNPQTRRLQGIHAALSLPEASLIALPDLMHTGWKREEPYAPPAADSSESVAHPGWMGNQCADDAPNSDMESPAWEHFLDHDIRKIDPPVLRFDDTVTGQLTLNWTTEESEATFYLEEATRPDWSDATQIYTGNDLSHTLYGRGQGSYYYRVRQRAGVNNSEWSDAVLVVVQGDSGWQCLSSSEASDRIVRQVQHELLRLCAVSGALFAILSIPSPRRAPQAIDYALSLRPAQTSTIFPPDALSVALSFAEEIAYSYGALYHPWLQVDNGTDTRLLPPEGTLLGSMARRANQRGAWIAPANQPLDAIIGLSPAIANTEWALMQAAHINRIMRHPRGTLTLNADTLIEDNEWRDINVRRLFTLLRRILLPIAERFVFEPNNRISERAIVRAIETVLGDLYQRGAFAGDTAETAFQVRTVIRPLDRDEGRFVVEIKVAPSLPMHFITVHLIQGNVPRIEEVTS